MPRGPKPAPVPSTERLGRALQVRRAELGIGRPELAVAAAISYPYLAEVEQGHKAPSLALLARLAHALWLTPSELLTRAEALPERMCPQPAEATGA